MTTKFLTPMVKADILAALEYFSVSYLSVSEGKSGEISLAYKARGKNKPQAHTKIEGIDFEYFLKTDHHARKKAVRRSVGKAIANLIAQGIDFKAINKASA